MPADDWDRIQEIFLAAADLPDCNRPAFLDTACIDDAELRAEVESLLCADASPAVRLSAVIQSEAGAVLQEIPRPYNDAGGSWCAPSARNSS